MVGSVLRPGAKARSAANGRVFPIPAAPPCQSLGPDDGSIPHDRHAFTLVGLLIFAASNAVVAATACGPDGACGFVLAVLSVVVPVQLALLFLSGAWTLATLEQPAQGKNKRGAAGKGRPVTPYRTSSGRCRHGTRQSNDRRGPRERWTRRREFIAAKLLLDKFQLHFTLDSPGCFLQGGQSDGIVFRVEQAMELRAARLHAPRHRSL